MELQHLPTGPHLLSPPEEYAQKVVNYSKLDTRAKYFSGTHYTRLGNFLISAYKTYGDEHAIAMPENVFPSVTLCDLTKTREDPTRIKLFSRPEDFSHFLDSQQLKPNEEPNGETSGNVNQSTGSLRRPTITSQTSSQAHTRPKHSGRVIFLRGFPSPQWLNHLGAALDVDPEFFYRHLDIGPIGITPNAPRLEYSYSTPFPQSRDLIQLRVCNTGSWDMKGNNAALASLRQSCEDSFRDHLEDFEHRRGFSAGDSIVRRFILHDLHNFSIEQRISIEVIYHTHTWSIVTWMDSGRDLNHCNSGPWLRGFPLTNFTRLHPIFQYRSRMALSTDAKEFPSTQNENDSYPQSIGHLHEKYGRHLKTAIMSYDAFYALNELFEFSAASVDQLLELFEDNIRMDLHHPVSTRLSELLILKVFMDDYRSYVKDILEIVCARGNSKWPRATEPKQREKADRAADQLENRYKRLLRRCEYLAEHCESSISIMMSLEAHSQTEKAMTQTDRLGKLSVLAYIYIPITFAATFYGMNFKELGSQLSIWSFFVMAVPLLVISILAWFVDVRATCMTFWRFIKGKRERQ